MTYAHAVTKIFCQEKGPVWHKKIPEPNVFFDKLNKTLGSGTLRYPTWIRTKTSRIRICGTTVILSGSVVRQKKLKNIQPFVGLLGFEPRQTESKSVVLPLHHNPILFPFFQLGLQK